MIGPATWRSMMKSNSQTLTNRVKAYRTEKGFSQAELANLVGVKRQAIYDIESGKYAPNTLVALRLANHLSCRVEDLFREEGEQAASYTLAEDLSDRDGRVSLARVRDKLVAYPLKGSDPFSNSFEAADGVLSPGEKQVKLLCPPDMPDKTLVLMGCDPAFALLASHVSRRACDIRFQYRFASSFKALQTVAAGHAHLAGTHLHSGDSDLEDNIELARKKLNRQSATIMGFSRIEEGLLVAPGNPYGIRSLEDLANPKVRLANREPGAALRVLLDDLLRKGGIPAEAITGYGNEVHNHLEGVMRVLYGQADVALGFRAIAVNYGLDFIPLVSAQCELVLPQDMMSQPAMKMLLDALQTRALRDDIKSLAGYDAESTGSVIAEI